MPAHTESIAVVVDALRQATHLTTLHLGLSTSSYVEGNADPAADGWDHELGEEIQLPPLGGIPCLHSLDVAGLALLPPDWQQLSSLRQLAVRPLVNENEGWVAETPYDFSQLLPGLTGSLTQLRLPWNGLTPALCGLEQLRELTVRGGSVALPAEVSSLASLTALTLHDDALLHPWSRDLAAPVPPLGTLPALRRVTVQCPEHRRAAWADALQAQMPQGAQLPAVRFVCS